jgi:hypothetical protein
MRANYPDQNQSVSLYIPYIRSSDYLMTKPNDKNWNYALQLDTQKGVEYFGLDDIKNNAARIKQNGAYFVAYDLEKQYSPTANMVDPVSSMKQASQAAHQNGLKLLAIPSHKLTDLYYASFAPVADIYGLQAQLTNPILYAMERMSTILFQN